MVPKLEAVKKCVAQEHSNVEYKPDLAKYNSQMGFYQCWAVLSFWNWWVRVGYICILDRQLSKIKEWVLTLGQWSSTIIEVVSIFEWSLKKIKQPSQRTFPLSFWFFVSTFMKTIRSLKYFKNLKPEVLLILKVFKKREPGGSAILKFKEE